MLIRPFCSLTTEEKANMFSFIFSHVGRVTWTKHVRKGKELPEIARDDNYDFNFQVINSLTSSYLNVIPISALIANTSTVSLTEHEEHFRFGPRYTKRTNLRRLVILQKRIIRIMYQLHFHAHANPIFKDFGVLKFNDIDLLQLGQFLYSCKDSFLPPKFSSSEY